MNKTTEELEQWRLERSRRIGKFRIPDWHKFRLPDDSQNEYANCVSARCKMYAMLAALFVIDTEGTLDLQHLLFLDYYFNGSEVGRRFTALSLIHDLRRLNFITSSRFYDCAAKLNTEEEAASEWEDGAYRGRSGPIVPAKGSAP